jgi:hypothetical protein
VVIEGLWALFTPLVLFVIEARCVMGLLPPVQAFWGCFLLYIVSVSYGIFDALPGGGGWVSKT